MKPTIHHRAARSRKAQAAPLTLVYREPEPAGVHADEATASLAYDETAPETLNIVERLAAQVGEWVGALSELWGPRCGPFFAADGQIAACSAAFAPKSASDAPPSAL
jgi:hypothetical protein